jgi:hypothetical protein
MSCSSWQHPVFKAGEEQAHQNGALPLNRLMRRRMSSGAGQQPGVLSADEIERKVMDALEQNRFTWMRSAIKPICRGKGVGSTGDDGTPRNKSQVGGAVRCGA